MKRPPVDLSQLMIFPLPRALLFPHAVLPLHVFEPRYRQLLSACLAGSRTMAIACVDEARARAMQGDAAVRAEPPVRALIGVGVVVAHEAMPDGRSNILLRGIGRAQINEELPMEPDRTYRVVRASWADDDELSSERDDSVRQTLAALAGQLASRLPEGGDTLRALVSSQPDAGALSDLLAAALVTEPSMRLRLFETLDVAARADGVADAIGIALATLADSRGPSN